MTATFEDEIASLNLERLPLGLLMLTILHAIHVVVFLVPWEASEAMHGEWRRAIGTAHLAMIPLSGLGTLAARAMRADPRRWRLAPPILSGVYLLFSAWVTGLDQLVGPTPTAFASGSIGLAVYFRFRMVERLVIYALGLAAALVMIQLMQEDPSLRQSLQVNCVTIAAIALLVSRQGSRLQRQIWEDRRTILHQARTDALTGVLTRGAFMEELERGNVRGGFAALVLIDIDDLKVINDGQGHAAGDAAILAVTNAVRQVVRECDVVGRLGGDELCVVLDDVDREAASAIATRICEHCERAGTTVSVGVALAIPGDASSRWLARADAAMYRAKTGGRNQVRD